MCPSQKTSLYHTPTCCLLSTRHESQILATFFSTSEVQDTGTGVGEREAVDHSQWRAWGDSGDLIDPANMRRGKSLTLCTQASGRKRRGLKFSLFSGDGGWV